MDVTLLGLVENNFRYPGRPGHEVVFVFEVRLADLSIYVEGWRARILDITESIAPIEWIEEADGRSGAVTLSSEIQHFLTSR
jgi:hypothetical protein